MSFSQLETRFLFTTFLEKLLMAQIDAFFKLMNEQGASDLHLLAGQQPVLRIKGELERVKYKGSTMIPLRLCYTKLRLSKR